MSMRMRQQPIKLSEIGIGIPASSDVLWHEPPTRRSQPSQYESIAKEIIERPGEYRLVAVYRDTTNRAKNLTYSVNRGRGAWGTVAKDGRFEATYTEADEDGLVGVYVRFVPEER